MNSVRRTRANATEKHLSQSVDSLLSRFVELEGPLQPPIDPRRLAPFCDVLDIENRPMVPEGVLAPVDGGFRMYLQSNFAARPGNLVRQRFTVAHELAHTFYFDRNGGVPKRKKDAPTGQKLEALCHRGASQILIPEILIQQEIRARGRVTSARTILDLADVFGVSAEVMIRRLQALPSVVDDNFAAILVDAFGGTKQLIRAACYGPMLLCHTIRPERDTEFDAWVIPLLAPGMSQQSEWTHSTLVASIVAKKVFRSSRSFVLDLRFGRPGATTNSPQT